MEAVAADVEQVDVGAAHVAGAHCSMTLFTWGPNVMAKQTGRKALIVLSDGVDRGSKKTLASAIEAAQRADTLVYSILFQAEEQTSGYGRGGMGGMGGGMGGRGGGMGGGMGGRHGGGYPRYPQESRPDGKKSWSGFPKKPGAASSRFRKSIPSTPPMTKSRMNFAISTAWAIHPIHPTTKPATTK